MLLKNYSGLILEAGTDEAGRGCIAGPVTAAAVILPEDFENEFVNDSKKITAKLRYSLRQVIEEKALTYKVTHIYEDTIEEINILHASILAMQQSVLALTPKPEFLIIDGNKFTPIPELPYECIVKGDMKYLSLAAASILAKTYRDDYMDQIHEEFPMYNWKKNKGYPTKEHREAIAKFGPCKYHRKSFKLLPDQLKLDF
ncbi:MULTISPECIES: ribonuclease HII [Myroides]|uniref:Ribonuclease HII n=1 Tax=Myroides albus TaxID=2562892 RepID=A0A6I3LN96_9FLAO|nr:MULTISPECIES: ribonuclease HII [Myroides]MTG98780.1 ribonuclease HII [Myroides albus]MVX35487.1 ribonuclease HII [Myroides sp. LoEW2-1]UVD80684.1 ribonuclease HII [Myroides albus]